MIPDPIGLDLARTHRRESIIPEVVNQQNTSLDSGAYSKNPDTLLKYTLMNDSCPRKRLRSCSGSLDCSPHSRISGLHGK